MSVPWYLMAKGKGRGGYKTASGPIVSINDALAAPLRSLSIGIDPVQDLHGYDNPWPAGGGKNKFNGTFLQGYWAYADGRWTDSNAWITTEKIPCKPSTYYTVSAVNKLTRWQGFVWYDENGDYISTTNQQANQNIGYTAESPATAAYMAYNIAGYPNTSSTISPSDVSQFQIEEGRNATTYAPYSNICPISGWDSVTAWRTGKNLLDPDKRTQTSNNIRYYVADGFLLKSGQTYTLSISGSPANGLYFVRMSDNSNIALKYNDTKLTYTPTEDVLVKFNIYYTPAPSGGLGDIKCQLELGSTATPYAPYTGNEFTIQLGDTVYGGYISVGADGSTELVADKAYALLNDPDQWTESSGTQDFAYQGTFNDRKIFSTSFEGLLCSSFLANNSKPAYIRWTGASSYKIGIKNNTTSYALSDIQQMAENGEIAIVYELATPITIPLTPTEISTLAGQNVLWADAGEVDVEYLASGGANPDLMKLAVAFMGKR